MEPEPAMQAHLDVGGRTLLPVHWATFNLANHDWDEPIRRTVVEAARLEIDVVTPRIGEWIEVPGSQPSQAWWEAIREEEMPANDPTSVRSLSPPYSRSP